MLKSFIQRFLDFARNDRLLVFASIARFGVRRLDAALGLITAFAPGALPTGFTIVFDN
jgi:hypothetical protein